MAKLDERGVNGGDVRCRLLLAEHATASRVSAALMAKRPNWSRPLPQPLEILDGDKPILTLATVGDVRELIVKRLPKESREKSTWQYVAARALDAAHGAVVGEHSMPPALKRRGDWPNVALSSHYLLSGAQEEPC
jgi:hypothetical protein